MQINTSVLVNFVGRLQFGISDRVSISMLWVSHKVKNLVVITQIMLPGLHYSSLVAFIFCAILLREEYTNLVYTLLLVFLTHIMGKLQK